MERGASGELGLAGSGVPPQKPITSGPQSSACIQRPGPQQRRARRLGVRCPGGRRRSRAGRRRSRAGVSESQSREGGTVTGRSIATRGAAHRDPPSPGGHARRALRKPCSGPRGRSRPPRVTASLKFISAAEEPWGCASSRRRATPASQLGTPRLQRAKSVPNSGGAAGLRTRAAPSSSSQPCSRGSSAPPSSSGRDLRPRAPSAPPWHRAPPAAQPQVHELHKLAGSARPARAMEEERGSAPAALSALEKNVAELTVMDVYDIASLVGHEFERVIDQHGCEAIARLMPKVVRVLEILEVLVSRHHVAPELDELRLELDRLRVERMDRIEKERKHQKELELVEDVWRGEAQDLLSQIAQLQEENKQLITNLNHKDVGFSEEGFQKQEGMSERERQVMKRLKEVVDKQRDEIRAKDRELGLKNEDVEALQQQQTRLMKINHDLRHRVTVVEAQGKALIEQKVELEADLQTKEQEMGSLRAELGKLRERLQGEHSQNGEEEAETPQGGEECISDAEKAALDLKDPNRPRFTLQELRDVLHERNELKSKVFLLQEELAYYKSEETEEESRMPQPPPIMNPRASPQPESGIKRLLFTAVLPMVAAGLILDDPTLQPVRRLVSLVGTVFGFLFELNFWLLWLPPACPFWPLQCMAVTCVLASEVGVDCNFRHAAVALDLCHCSRNFWLCHQ